MEAKHPTLRIDDEALLRNIAIRIAEAEAEWQAKNPMYGLDANIKANIKKKVVKEFFKLAEKSIGQVKARFADDLVEDSEKWPRTWMIKDRKISKRLAIDIMNPQVCKWAQVMNFLWKKSGRLDETKRLAPLLPEERRSQLVCVGTGEEAEVRARNYVLLAVGAREMAGQLYMSVSSAQKYLKAFSAAGIILDSGCRTTRPRSGGQKIYAIGLWAGHRDYLHRIPFLTDTPAWRRTLAEFSLQ